jgi:ABC-type transport system involved in multi-copper enzyme maturation permease subunit
MLSVPVITREMLVAARQPLYYRMREAVVGLAILLMFAVVLNQGGGPESGLKLYTALHCSVVVMILFFAPALTGDAISREKRDGTLDLLFLTPLTGRLIVSSKLFSNALRMLTIWLACLPIVVIPVLAGGVTPLLIALSLSVQLICLVLSLLAGLTVSIFVQRALAAVLCSIFAALLAICAHYTVFAFLLSATIPSLDILRQFYVAIVTVLFFPATIVRSALPARSLDLFVFVGGTTLYVLCISVLWALILGRALAARRQKEGETARAAWFRRVFLTPAIFKEALRRSMRRKIERNPLIWMEYRTAWSRSARSVVLAMLILVESYVMLIDPFSAMFLYTQLIAAFIFVLLICVTASSSFQREKENGAFELLLVAPFSEEKLIWGRIRAVWSYYKPAGMVFLLFIVAALSGDNRLFAVDEAFRLHLISIGASAVTVPVVGLYFALARKNFLVILTSTAFFAIFLPYFSWDVFQGFVWFLRNTLHFFPLGNLLGTFAESTTLGTLAVLAVHWVLLNAFVSRTLACLRRREFAL